jgi:octaprenyl-diphosphate synthase
MAQPRLRPGRTRSGDTAKTDRVTIAGRAWHNAKRMLTECLPTKMDALRALIADDLADVDRLIKLRLYSEVALINQLSHYIVANGGKRLRPVLALLSAHAHGYGGRLHIHLAAIVELIHTATLLHDDVVDASDLRRGRETANLVFGNEASVLVGDFLYSRAFQMMVDVRDMRVMEILSDATNTIAEGEVMQLVNCHDPDTSEERYLAIIHNKTAKLFEAAARLGAVLSGAGVAAEEAMAAYGRHLGTAYQLIDDVFDYTASAEQLGKNIGDDLAEGKPTLPLLYALWHGSATQGALLRGAIEEGGRGQIGPVIEAIEATGAITYTAALARWEAGCALRVIEDLGPSPYKDALLALAAFAVDRRS